MPTDPRDDFGVFAESEHMFFGLQDPYALIRHEVEAGLKRQVADSDVEKIVTFDAPKFLTIGRKRDDDPNSVIVTWFAFCVRANIDVTWNGGTNREHLPATLTFMFGRWDEAGRQLCRAHLDVHADAERYFDPDQFQNRFIAFRQADHPD